jgi:hypothetical protein
MARIPPSVSNLGERRNGASRNTLVHRVSAEFNEMPCLLLTRGQARRLFALRADVCDRVLATLVADGTLTRLPDDRFRLSEAVRAVRTDRLRASIA